MAKRSGEPRLCSFPGCDRPFRARGWCTTHWMRWRQHGDPARGRLTDRQRFDKSVVVDAASGCHLWTGTRQAFGHGRFSTAETGVHRNHMAHRWLWEQERGPVPREMHLDHLCTNPPCVNLDHLVIATPAENTLRGRGATAVNARKTHCKRGHPLEGDNLVIRTWRGHKERQCRTCVRDRTRAREAKRRALRALDREAR